MLFRSTKMRLTQINRADFHNDKEYYAFIMKIKTGLSSSPAINKISPILYE